jgi:hypothetical protein
MPETGSNHADTSETTVCPGEAPHPSDKDNVTSFTDRKRP